MLPASHRRCLTYMLLLSRRESLLSNACVIVKEPLEPVRLAPAVKMCFLAVRHKCQEE